MLPSLILTPDALAMIWFFGCWLGYNLIADNERISAHSLMGYSQIYRTRWSHESLRREANITDATLLGNLMRSIAFYANTSILLIGGLITALGAGDQLLSASIALSDGNAPQWWELKVLTLLVVFIYAYVKFSWSMRLFNILSVLLGAIPADKAQIGQQAGLERIMARYHQLAGAAFTKGERAYMFSLAPMTWFISPLIFALATTFMLGILIHRDFFSESNQVLRDYDR